MFYILEPQTKNMTNRRLHVGGWKSDSTLWAQWEVASWRHLSASVSVLGTLVSKDFSPDFRYIALGHANGDVSVWDIATGKKWCEFQGNLPTAVRGVVFLYDGTVLATGGEDGFIRLYDIFQRRELETMRGQMPAVHSLAVSPDGRRLASGGTRPNEAVRLWDVATRKDLLNLEGQGIEFRFTRFSPDGNILVAINSKYQLHLWRAPSWAEIEAAEGK
jgi:WD40 repeat protein